LLTIFTLTPARLAQLSRASRPRRRPARERYAYSGLRRFACLLMAAVMFLQFTLFPPEVSGLTRGNQGRLGDSDQLRAGRAFLVAFERMGGPV